jgi:hypothetical protein
MGYLMPRLVTRLGFRQVEDFYNLLGMSEAHKRFSRGLIYHSIALREI